MLQFRLRAPDEQLSGLFAGHRLAEVPALADRAAQSEDGGVGRLGLDAFDIDRHLERAGKRRHGPDDGAAFLVGMDVGDEAAVDLDNVERQRAQVRRATRSRCRNRRAPGGCPGSSGW